MDRDMKKDFWEELKILQTTIDKFDGFTFQIKNWFLTIFSAVIGYAVVNTNMTLLKLNFAIIIVFYSYEITYRVSHTGFLERSRKIQRLLRQNEAIANEDKPPYLDKYFFTEENCHKKENRATRDLREWKLFIKEWVCCLIQLRVSFLYLTAAIIAVIALCILPSR
jgi:hypothetical protein